MPYRDTQCNPKSHYCAAVYHGSDSGTLSILAPVCCRNLAPLERRTPDNSCLGTLPGVAGGVPVPTTQMSTTLSSSTGNSMLKLLRQYAIASFFGVLATSVTLAAMYRQVEISSSIEFQRKTNLALAHALVNAVKPQLVTYLSFAAQSEVRPVSTTAFPASLATTIAEIMHATPLNEIRIYNAAGVVLYSSRDQDAGDIDDHNLAMLSIANEHALTAIAYQDMFGDFGENRSEQNVARTAVLVRQTAADPILGSLVTRADLRTVAAQNNQAVIKVFGGILCILLSLYAVLLFIVSRARKTIESDQNAIRERTANLEALSVQLLEVDESQKMKLAANLHEGLAQTLTAIKCRLENSLRKLPPNIGGDKSLNETLSALDGAIEELQEIATDLRPASLDQLGLLPTICWYCREFEYLHPTIRTEQQISLLESEIPHRLRIVIYRTFEAALKNIGKNPAKKTIRVSLNNKGSDVVLAVDEIPQDSPTTDPAYSAASSASTPHFTLLQERVTLSGGTFATTRNPRGGVTLQASWRSERL